MKKLENTPLANTLSRRQFVHALTAGSLIASTTSLVNTAWSSESRKPLPVSPPVLTGTEFDLVIDTLPVNITGTERTAVAINGSLPGPTLRWKEGDTVSIRVTNRLTESTSIHWHGILLPYEMDGVPGISFTGIAPGETFTYQFTVRQSGTYWYHSHTGFQEQLGMFGAIIIDPAHPLPSSSEREYVVLLSDWTDEDPMRMLEKLKMQSDYYNFAQPTVVDFMRDITELGWTQAWQKRSMWNQMRMNPTDYADVSGYTYTYLINGASPNTNWTGLFKPGERIRLRFINAGTASFFDVRIPGLKLNVVSTDGQEVKPVNVDEFRIGAGETYDVIVTPDRDVAYTIFAQSMDRSGYARATLAPREGMQGERPLMDKPEWLSMTDMMGTADHSAHGSHGMASTVLVRHASTEFGPDVDMRVDNPRTSLDDPGVNLRNNGRRVLTYADLHTLGGPLDKRAPDREIELHLTGNMERYIWSIDGVPYGRSKPVHFRKNERLRIIMVNDTMMAHPFHLHGMWTELENAEGKFQVRKHTINIQPGQRVTYLVTADAMGRWAWHCHLLIHMDMGMFREVIVD